MIGSNVMIRWELVVFMVGLMNLDLGLCRCIGSIVVIFCISSVWCVLMCFGLGFLLILRSVGLMVSYWCGMIFCVDQVVNCLNWLFRIGLICLGLLLVNMNCGDRNRLM